MHLTEGSGVHVHLNRLDHCVPAVVTRIWDPDSGVVNLQLFFDGPGDITTYLPDMVDGHDWRQGVPFDETAARDNSWHWPEP